MSVISQCDICKGFHINVCPELANDKQGVRTNVKRNGGEPS